MLTSSWEGANTEGLRVQMSPLASTSMDALEVGVYPTMALFVCRICMIFVHAEGI